MERNVEHIYNHLIGADGGRPLIPPLPDDAPPPVVSPRVRELVAGGLTMQAIQQYRNETGCDLKTAKAVIEDIIA